MNDITIFRETLFSKKVLIECDEPGTIALKIIADLSKKAEIKNRVDEYETDGPEGRVRISFETEEKIDAYSSIRFCFNIYGEKGTRSFLEVMITSIIEIKTNNYGFFSESFAEFYREKLFGPMRGNIEKRMIKRGSLFEKIIREAPLP